MNEKRISRICWNTNGWVKPSGRFGKSKHLTSHEYKNGFGVEEWLFDFDKTIDGFTFSFLEPIAKRRSAYEDKTYDVLLFSRDSIKNIDYLIGEIKDLKVITKEEELKAIDVYKKNGWIQEMLNDLENVGADISEFKKWLESGNLFNVKFRREQVHFFDPIQIAETGTIKSYHYVFLRTANSFSFAERGEGFFKFQAKAPGDLDLAESVYERKTQLVELKKIHQEISLGLYDFLVEQYGKENVSYEQNALTGRMDLAVKLSNDLIIYEIKTYNSLRHCLRVAIGQLLEYAFWTSKEETIKEMIVVSDHHPDNSALEYLKRIREKYGIPLFYSQFDREEKKMKGKI